MVTLYYISGYSTNMSVKTCLATKLAGGTYRIEEDKPSIGYAGDVVTLCNGISLDKNEVVKVCRRGLLQTMNNLMEQINLGRKNLQKLERIHDSE